MDKHCADAARNQRPPARFEAHVCNLLGEVGAPPHVVSAALGHTIGDQLTAGYNKAAYSDPVRDAVGKLADRLDMLEMGGNIVTLPRRA